MVECAYRLEVVTEFLKAGNPIAKTDMLRSLLEKKWISTHWKFESRTVCFHGFETGNRTDQARIRDARTSWLDIISVIFDGSTRQGEAIATIV